VATPRGDRFPILADPVPSLDVIMLELLWIARRHGLDGRKIPPLAHCKLVEPSLGILRVSPRHGDEKVAWNITFINCHGLAYKKVK
jgi:hypothetical protein